VDIGFVPPFGGGKESAPPKGLGRFHPWPPSRGTLVSCHPLGAERSVSQWGEQRGEPAAKKIQKIIRSIAE